MIKDFWFPVHFQLWIQIAQLKVTGETTVMVLFCPDGKIRWLRSRSHISAGLFMLSIAESSGLFVRGCFLYLDYEIYGQFVPWLVSFLDHEFHGLQWAWLTTAIVLFSIPRSWNPWSICSLIVKSMVGLFSVPRSWIPWSVYGRDHEFHGQQWAWFTTAIFLGFPFFFQRDVLNFLLPTDK